MLLTSSVFVWPRPEVAHRGQRPSLHFQVLAVCGFLSEGELEGFGDVGFNFFEIFACVNLRNVGVVFSVRYKLFEEVGVFVFAEVDRYSERVFHD